MNQAPVREEDVVYPEPEIDEPKTEPRIRVQLLLPPESGGTLRFRAGVKHAQRLLARLKLAPAVMLGALVGSAPYLVQQHARARVSDEPRIVASASAEPEALPLRAASPVEPAAVQAPAPLPPPSITSEDEKEPLSAAPRPRPIERVLLVRARNQLRSGDGFGAQLVLQQLTQRVPHGKLMQQRKLLEIQVLQAIGAAAAARRAASDFAKAYPRSRELPKLSSLLLGS